MRRNVKFAGLLVKRYDRHGIDYVWAVAHGDTDMATYHLVMLNRLRNVLEYRYNTIV